LRLMGRIKQSRVEQEPFGARGERATRRLTATKKCGLVGWNATRWTAPFVLLNGDWLWCLDSW
jgi:hypothetical protein